MDFYLQHMRLEETVVLPEAEKHLSDADWHALNAAFATNQDPLSSRMPRDPQFDRLFTRIVMRAPAPVGLGQELRGCEKLFQQMPPPIVCLWYTSA